MSVFKPRKVLAAVPVLSRLVGGKRSSRHRKQSHCGADAIDTMERLYRLKRRGVISETEFAELKEKLKQQI